MITIYKITCLSTGMVYVGQTSRDIKARWLQHLHNAKNKPDVPLYTDILKYGGKEFFVEEIEKCEPHPIVSGNIDRERFWIQKLDTQYPSGYNIHPIKGYKSPSQVHGFLNGK